MRPSLPVPSTFTGSIFPSLNIFPAAGDGMDFVTSAFFGATGARGGVSTGVGADGVVAADLTLVSIRATNAPIASGRRAPRSRGRRLLWLHG